MYVCMYVCMHVCLSCMYECIFVYRDGVLLGKFMHHMYTGTYMQYLVAVLTCVHMYSHVYREESHVPETYICSVHMCTCVQRGITCEGVHVPRDIHMQCLVLVQPAPRCWTQTLSVSMSAQSTAQCLCVIEQTLGAPRRECAQSDADIVQCD